MTPLKIVHFITSIDKKSGGTATYIKLLAEKIAKEVNVIVATGISRNPIEIKDVKIHSFDLSLKKMVQFFFEAGKFLDEQKPDLLHINGIWELPNVVIQKCAQKRNIPVIISPHGMLEPWILKKNRMKKKLALFVYQKHSVISATSLHATAYSEYNNIRKLGIGTSMKIIENGIHTENAEKKKSWKKTKTLLFLSRIDPKKGIENLIDALAICKHELKEYKVIIAGEGEPDYIASLKKRALSNNLGHQIEFTGGVYGKTKWDLFKKADVFILPTHSENFGIVVAEALACGTPVITTKGAPWSDLSEYKCGWWIDIGVNPLSHALLDFARKTEKELEQMGRTGHAMVRSKYSADGMGRKMIRFYQSVLSPGRTTATSVLKTQEEMIS